MKMNWLSDARKKEYEIAKSMKSDVAASYFASNITEVIDEARVEVKVLIKKGKLEDKLREPTDDELMKHLTNSLVPEIYSCIETVSDYHIDKVLEKDGWERIEGVPYEGPSDQEIKELTEASGCDVELMRIFLDQLVAGEYNLPRLGQIRTSKGATTIKLDHSMLRKMQHLLEIEANSRF